MPTINCIDCELTKGDKSCFYSPVSANKKIMVIADKPYDYEVGTDQPFSTKSLQLVDVVYKKGMRIAEDVFHPAYLIKCATEHEVTYDRAITCINTKLVSEIKAVAPTVIVGLGEQVCKFFIGEDYKQHIGKPVSMSIAGHDFTFIANYTAGYARNNDAILKLFAKNLELAYNIAHDVTAAEVPVQVDYIHDLQAFEQLVQKIELAKICCFDFETYDVDEYPLYTPDFKATCLAVSFQLGHSAVIPLFNFDNTYFTEAQILWMLQELGRRVFANPLIKKIAHNIKFDRHVLNIYDIPFKGVMYDTMLMHHIIDEVHKHGLKDLVDTYIPECSGYEDAVKKFSWQTTPLPILELYASADTHFELLFFYQFKKVIANDPILYRIWRNETLPATEVLWQAEAHGMLLDKDKSFKYEADLLGRIEIVDGDLHKIKKVKNFVAAVDQEKRQEKIVQLNLKIQEQTAKGNKRSVALVSGYERQILEIQAGKGEFYTKINWGSWQQLDRLLYTSIGYNLTKPKIKKNSKSDAATGKDILKDLKDKTGFVDTLLRYRGLAKLCSTYIVGVRRVSDPENRVHTSFMISGTKTGRLSSKGPNMQNIPSESKTQDPVMKEVAPFIKDIFIVPAGYTLVAADYKQIELKVAAEFANETTMLQAYADNKDLHIVTAMSAARLAQEQWDALPDSEKKVNRSKAKAGNFGLIYEISIEGFMEFAKNTYGVVYTYAEAEEYVYRFFRTYPNLKNWHEQSKAIARRYGYVRTLFGRKRHTPDINSDISFKRGEDERVAINSPVQGTAGELTIFSLILLYYRLDKRCILVNTVHDSIMWYIPDWLVDESVDIIMHTCENLPTQQYFKNALTKVKLSVDIEVSKRSWKDLKPYEKVPQ